MSEPLFTPDEQQKFDAGIAELLTHYPSDRKSAAMLPALRLLQTMKGWLPPEGMKLVAETLETTVERAYEVATFYVMYHTEKPGKYVIDVCTNLSCALRGAEGMLKLPGGEAGHQGRRERREVLPARDRVPGQLRHRALPAGERGPPREPHPGEGRRAAGEAVMSVLAEKVITRDWAQPGQNTLDGYRKNGGYAAAEEGARAWRRRRSPTR